MRKECTLVLFDDDGNVIPNNTTKSPNDVIENQNDVIGLISRADEIEAVKKEIQDFEANYMHGEDDEEYGHDIGFVAGLHRAKTFIRSLPSADAVEVVRCKDCKFRRTEICV